MKELNTKTILKRVVAMLLALVMCVNLPVHSVDAEDTTKVTIKNISGANQSSHSRFLIYFNFYDEAGETDVTPSAGWYNCTSWSLDGVEQGNVSDMEYYQDSGSRFFLTLPYAAIQEGATSSDDLYSHLITIEAGTMIGSMTVAETVHFSIYQSNVTSLASVAETTISYKSVETQDGSARYWLHLNMPGLVDSTKLPSSAGSFDWCTSHIYVDGNVLTETEYYFTDTTYKNTMVLFLYYRYFEEGVTAASGIKETHYVTIKKGTLINDVLVTNDLNLRINPGGSVDVLNTVTPQWSHNELADGYRSIYYTFTGDYTEHPLSYEEGKARLILGNKSVNCYWSKYASEDNEYGVCFRVPETFLVDGDVIILEEGLSIGNCVVGKAVYTQFSATDTTDYGTELIAIDNSWSSHYWITAQSRYLFSIKAPGGSRSGNNFDVKWEVNGEEKNLKAWTYTDEVISFYTNPEHIVDSATVDSLNNVSLVFRKGTILDNYYMLNSLGVIINGTTVTEFEVEDVPITEVKDVDLPDAIVVPAHNYRNQQEVRNKDFYFSPLGTNPLPTRLPSDEKPGYTFKTGGIYLNDSLEPLSGVTMHNYGYCYYVWLGNSTQLNPGDVVTIDGIVEADGYSVQFQRTSFVVDKNQHMLPLGSNDVYTSNLEDVYVDLGEHSYVIPESDSIKINDQEVDAQDGIELSTAGEYTIERVKGNVTYKQNVICYQTGDANADGNVNIIDLIAAKNSSKHTQQWEIKGADVTNDSEVDDDDLYIIRDLLIEKVDATEVRDEYQEMVFGVISDVHLTAKTDKREQDNLKKALEYYKSNNAELIIVNGDLTDRGTEDSYTLLLNIINEVYPDNEPRPQIMFTTGNHEFYDAWPGVNATEGYATCATLFKESLNLDSSNNHYILGGYDFITISLDATEGTYGGVGQYKPDTVKYLQEQLKLATDRDGYKPIFVALHIPLEDAGAEFSEKDIYTESDIYSILKDYKQVVLFSSHTHNILNDERAIMQDDFTAIDTASLHYSSVTDKTLYENTSADWSKESALFAQGLLIRVKQNQVNVGRWDFIYDRPIGTAWSFESKDVKKYRSDRQNSAPTFNENPTVNAIWNTKTSCAISFNPAVATEGSNVQRYKIEVSNEGSVVDTYYYFNDYMDREAPEYVTYTVNGLDCNKDYTFTITAQETFGNESSSISGGITAYTNEN